MIPIHILFLYFPIHTLYQHFKYIILYRILTVNILEVFPHIIDSLV